jgi:hypothetical protein
VAVILVIANPSDPATRIGYHYMRLFAEHAAKAGHTVIFQKTPTLQALYTAITTYDPKLVVANGHGGFKSLTVGPNVLIGIKSYDEATHKKLDDQNPEWFQGRIVLLLTCNAGRELVQGLISYGAEAVLGYREPFIFLSDDTTPPERDKEAKPFFLSLLQPALQLINGANFGEAIRATNDAFSYYYEEAQSSNDKDMAKYLRFDKENLVATGDFSVRL